MIVFIQRPLKAFHNIDHARKSGHFKGIAGTGRTMSAAADQQHRPVQVIAHQLLHLVDKFRIDLPVRPILPGHVLGTQRMANIHELDFGPTVDEHGLGILLKASRYRRKLNLPDHMELA